MTAFIYGKFWEATYVVRVENMDYIHSYKGEVLEHKFILEWDILRTSFFKKREIEGQTFVLTNHQIINVEHLGGGDYGLTRVPYSEILQIKTVKKGRSLKIYIGGGNGDITIPLGIYLQKSIDFIKSKRPDLQIE